MFHKTKWLDMILNREILQENEAVNKYLLSKWIYQT
jgi:hypothetical protein